MANTRITDKPELTKDYDKVVLLGSDPADARDYKITPEGLAKIVSGRVVYDTECTTAAETAAKVITIEGFTELVPGLMLWITFTNGNTAANPTLSVNGQTAIPLKVQGGDIPSLFIEANKKYKLEYIGNEWNFVNQSQSSVELLDNIYGVAVNLDNGDYNVNDLKEVGRYTWTTKVPAGIVIEGRTEEDNKYGSLTVTKVGSGNDRKQVINFGIDNSQFSRTNPGGNNPWGKWKQTATKDMLSDGSVTKLALGTTMDGKEVATVDGTVENAQQIEKQPIPETKDANDFVIGMTETSIGEYTSVKNLPPSEGAYCTWTFNTGSGAKKQISYARDRVRVWQRLRKTSGEWSTEWEEIITKTYTNLHFSDVFSTYDYLVEDNTSLNDFKNGMTYFSATQYHNLTEVPPLVDAYRVETFEIASNVYKFQYAYGRDKCKIFYRYKTNNKWTTWHQIATTEQLSDGSVTKVADNVTNVSGEELSTLMDVLSLNVNAKSSKRIKDEEDLDALKTPGVYTQMVAREPNAPFPNGYYVTYIVYKHFSNTNGNLFQIAILSSQNKIKTRILVNGKWLDWKELATTDLLNKVGSGRNLMTVLGASSLTDLASKIKALGTDYSSLQPGDYISIPSLEIAGIGTVQNVSGNLDFEIAGFDHYNGVGDTDSGRGILFVNKNCMFRHRMNPLNSDGNHTNAGGYNGCELKGILNGAVAEALEKALGVSLKTVHRLVDTHGSWAWTAEKCFLPTEVEIFGYQAWGRGGYYGGTSAQYPIYALDPSRRCKKYNGARQWYWEGTSDSSSSTYFCFCYNNGNASNGGAGYGDGGVSPAFYL